VQCGAQPDEASNTLTRRRATYNRILDSRTRQPADAFIRVDAKISEHRFNANISRSSYLELRLDFADSFSPRHEFSQGGYLLCADEDSLARLFARIPDHRWSGHYLFLKNFVGFSRARLFNG
jgi:hypothetical protein